MQRKSHWALQGMGRAILHRCVCIVTNWCPDIYTVHKVYLVCGKSWHMHPCEKRNDEFSWPQGDDCNDWRVTFSKTRAHNTHIHTLMSQCPHIACTLHMKACIVWTCIAWMWVRMPKAIAWILKDINVHFTYCTWHGTLSFGRAFLHRSLTMAWLKWLDSGQLVWWARTSINADTHTHMCTVACVQMCVPMLCVRTKSNAYSYCIRDCCRKKEPSTCFSRFQLLWYSEMSSTHWF